MRLLQREKFKFLVFLSVAKSLTISYVYMFMTVLKHLRIIAFSASANRIGSKCLLTVLFETLLLQVIFTPLLLRTTYWLQQLILRYSTSLLKKIKLCTTDLCLQRKEYVAFPTSRWALNVLLQIEKFPVSEAYTFVLIKEFQFQSRVAARVRPCWQITLLVIRETLPEVRTLCALIFLEKFFPSGHDWTEMITA